MEVTSAVWMMLILLSNFASPSRAHKLRPHRNHQKGSTDFDFSSYYETLTEAPPQSPLPNDVIVGLHQEVRLQCEIPEKSEPMDNSRWWHGNEIAVDSTTVHANSHHYTLNPKSGELLITDVTAEDGGLWWCEVHDPETGRVVEAERGLKLIVTDPPRAVYLEVDGKRLDENQVFLTVIEGTPLTVTCVVEGGLPAPKVNWKLTLDKLLPQSELNVTLVEDGPQKTRSQLRLGDVQREDRNTSVTCLVNHVTQTKPINATVLLDVHYPPRAVYLEVDGKRLDENQVFLTVIEGTPLTVTCVVEGGLPAPKVNWKLTLDKLLPQSELNVTLVEDGPQKTRSQLRLGDVQREDRNTSVTCLVNHVTQTKSINATVLLDVHYPPSFIITREPTFGCPLVEGISFSLKCDVDSNPPSKPIWVKDDGPPPVQQSEDGYLNFTVLHREHSGWYKCMSGEFSSIGYRLNIQPSDDVTEDPGSKGATSTERQVEVALGGAVHLQCPGTGVSCWSRVGTGGTLEPVGVGPELKLKKVLYQEAGSYRCISGGSPRLEDWKPLVNIDLSVTGAPAVYPSRKKVRAIPGQELSIMVEYCANPPANRVFWITKRLLLKPGDTSSTLIAHHIKAGSSPHCHQAVLTLNTVRPRDKGEYMFVVRSPKGLAEGSVFINVTNLKGLDVTAGGQCLSPGSILYVITLFCFLFWNQPHYH